jgi:hypothetical protein
MSGVMSYKKCSLVTKEILLVIGTIWFQKKLKLSSTLQSSLSLTFVDDQMNSDMKWKEVFNQTSYLFTPLVYKEFPNIQKVQSRQQIVERESSVSYISALPKQQLEQFQQDVRSLLEKYDISGDKLFIPYITDLFHCQKQ